MATKFKVFFILYYFQKMEGYIFIGEEGNRRGHLGFPKVPYIKTSLEISKTSQKIKRLLGKLKRYNEKQKSHGFAGFCV